MDQVLVHTSFQVQSKLRSAVHFKLEVLELLLEPLRDNSVTYQKTLQLPTDTDPFTSLRLPTLTLFLDPHKQMLMRTTLTSKRCFQVQVPMIT